MPRNFSGSSLYCLYRIYIELAFTNCSEYNPSLAVHALYCKIIALSGTFWYLGVKELD